ncbi:MAG: hypothetical protein AB7E51_06750 [Pseudodesulfovibrio sp.]|uniref:hypothetical protein n=1 Tax=Pseudodesulfovibrio sp. TaxID=2035812 RepID=UPI003D145513
MSWKDKYMDISYRDRGRGYEGCDCWGLVWLVYRDTLDTPVSSFVDDYDTSINVPPTIVSGRTHDWVELPVDDLSDFRQFDVLLFTVMGRFHTGIVSDPRRRIMLHVRDIDCKVSEVAYTSINWRHRLDGRLRHVSRA